MTVVHTPLDARIHRREIRSLLDAGHEVVYAAPFTGHGVSRGQVDARLEVVDLPRALRWHRGGALWQSRRCLQRHLTDVDVVIVHDPELLLAVAGMTKRVPVVWDVHEDLAASFGDKSWIPRLLGALLRRGTARLERWAERSVALILAEEGYRARFEREHVVVPNLPPLPPPPRGPVDDRVVYVGRVSRLRGAGELARVGALLSADGLAVEVLGAVDTDVADILHAAERAGHVRLAGFVPNDLAMERIDGALAGLCLLHDHPNYRHSLPTKVVEYQAAGIPVITTPLPVAAEIVSEAGSGRVVPFGDVDAVVATVRELAADRDLARALGAAGRSAAERGQSWDASAPAFVAAVEDAAGLEPAGAQSSP